MNKSYDVVIVGGGIVGLTLALALAKTDFKVIVIEKNPAPKSVLAGVDFRVSAINLASRAIFKALNVWSPLALRAGVFEQIRVFEPPKVDAVSALQDASSISPYELHFDSNLIEQPQLGFILQHASMLQALTEELANNRVEILYEEEIAAIKLETEKSLLTLKSGESVMTQLVVGADGKHSHLRDLLGVLVKERDYLQVALVAQVHTEKKHQKTAWQCFRDAGPLAFLPLQNENSCSIVWSMSPDEAEELQNLSNEIFEHRLATAFENRLGDVQLQSPRFIFPLKMRYATPFVKPGCALVGDAVHTIHPLAGQGLNLGLLDAVCLAQVLQEAREKSMNIGDYLVLRRYERWRKSQHLALITAMDVFKQGFGLSTPPLRWLRRKILRQLNQTDFFKRACMLYAAGLAGDLPKICTT